jgi:hypothetical protein
MLGYLLVGILRMGKLRMRGKMRDSNLRMKSVSGVDLFV